MPPELKRAYGPDDLRPLLAANGFDAAILVQTVTEVAETREFLRIAAEHDIVAGVVGWVDLTDPQMPATLSDLLEVRMVGISGESGTRSTTNPTPTGCSRNTSRQTSKRLPGMASSTTCCCAPGNCPLG